MSEAPSAAAMPLAGRPGPGALAPALAPAPALALALSRLAEKGEAEQWTAEAVLGGGLDVAHPRWLPRKFHAALISQFYHGELATQRLCRILLKRIDDPRAGRCLSIQIADEERHAQVYRAYLKRLGDIRPVEPALEEAFERALSWSGPPEALIAAFNIVLEGEALRALENMGGWLNCPLFQRINGPICRDEARHFAFGRIYLRRRLPGLDREQRVDIYRWLKGLWLDTAFGTLDGFRIPGLITRRRRKAWAESGWQGHRRNLISVGLLDSDEARRAETGGPVGRGVR